MSSIVLRQTRPLVRRTGAFLRSRAALSVLSLRSEEHTSELQSH